MLKYIMIPIWWVYAEMRFIKYRIRTDILKKPDRMGWFITEAKFDPVLNEIHPQTYGEFNIDKNIRNLRIEYKRGNIKKRCLFT